MAAATRGIAEDVVAKNGRGIGLWHGLPGVSAREPRRLNLAFALPTPVTDARCGAVDRLLWRLFGLDNESTGKMRLVSGTRVRAGALPASCGDGRCVGSFA